MKTNTMDRIRELDQIWAKETSEFLQLGRLYHGPSPLFLQEKYLDGIDLPKMSKKWRVSIEELRMFVAVQRHINNVANGDFEMLSSEDVADHFGLPSTDFKEYVQEQAKLIKEAHKVDEDDDMALWRSATAEDFGDPEEDILQDAAVWVE